MGWFDGFPFVNRDEQARREKEFTGRVLPFGEEQKAAALCVLHQLLQTHLRDEELLYCYIAAKDALTLYGTELPGQQSARAKMPENLRLGEDAARLILSLAMLDLDTKAIQDFPSADAVRLNLACVLV